jgi:hypothetical protein
MRIEGRATKRPASAHPNPEAWDRLRAEVRALQDNECGACWRSGNEHRLELHHRHYDTWGRETQRDVVLLCVSCHDAITSRIRAERFARGDVSAAAESKIGRETAEVVRFRPSVAGPVVPQVEPEPTLQRRRPAVKQINVQGAF